MGLRPERYTRVSHERDRERQAMRDYLATDGCRMEFLRRELDDPGAARCGRCDGCAGPFIDTAVSEASLAGARGELARLGVDVAPRAMWPTGLAAVGVPLSGKIGAAERAEAGRAIGRLTDLGWGTRLRALLAEDAPDVAVPEDVLRAAVAVLAAWGWEQRPAGVVMMASGRRPELVNSVAERLAAIGRLPMLGRIDRHGGDGASRVNSAQRVRALHEAITVGPDLTRTFGNLGGAPVLLVDDYADTGWTVALASRALRRAGSGPVLPFVLAVAGAR